MTSLNNIVKEIKKLTEQFKNENGNKNIKISNKEFNLWMANEIYQIRQEVSSNKTKIKMLCWTLGLMVALFGITITIVKG